MRGVPCTQFNTWHYGDACPGNLLGTFRTLDQANGPVKLGKGILSRDGWSILDDSATCEIAPAEEINGKPNPYGAWVKSRAQKLASNQVDTRTCISSVTDTAIFKQFKTFISLRALSRCCHVLR